MDKFPSRERSAATAYEPRVSAIVVVQNVAARPSGRAQLELCLRSVLSEPLVDELILVDPGADAETASALRAFKADRRDVKLVVAPSRKSVAACANLGAEHARGRWLLFVDPNVVLQRGAVARLTALNSKAPELWVAGGRLTDTEGRDRASARTRTLNGFSPLAVTLGGFDARPTRRRAAAATRVGAVSGAFMLTPRAGFASLNGFDEDFATDGADLDFCRRAAEAGGAVLFHPQAAGVQFGSARRGKRFVQGMSLLARRSARTPMERAFAFAAPTTLALALWLKNFVAGEPRGQSGRSLLGSILPK